MAYAPALDLTTLFEVILPCHLVDPDTAGIKGALKRLGAYRDGMVEHMEHKVSTWIYSGRFWSRAWCPPITPLSMCACMDVDLYPGTHIPGRRLETLPQLRVTLFGYSPPYLIFHMHFQFHLLTFGEFHTCFTYASPPKT